MLRLLLICTCKGDSHYHLNSKEDSNHCAMIALVVSELKHEIGLKSGSRQFHVTEVR